MSDDPHESPLERLLRHATQETSMRPAFYRRLLASEVLVPVRRPAGQIGNTIPADTTIDVITLVRYDGVSVIPFFTSADRVFEYSPNGASCVLMPVRELFQGRPDRHFHVNPYSRYGREFLPHEAQSLLNPEVNINGHSRAHLPADDDSIIIEPPRDVPSDLLDALKVLLAREVKVRAAYVAGTIMPSQVVKRSVLIAIDFLPGADPTRVLCDIGAIVTDYMTPTSPHVDLVELPRDGSRYAAYFEQAEPFYEIGAARFLPQ